jgi:hypothetical protein
MKIESLHGTSKIGALQIASLRVESSVREGDDAAGKSLLRRVDRATRSGGDQASILPI